jgi:hypothetical protein
LWNQAVHTEREVTENRADIILKTKKRENTHTDRYGDSCGQKYRAKGNEKEAKIPEFLYRDTTNVEYEVYDYTGNNWSHRNGNKRFKESFESHTRNTFNRFTTTDRYTWNITHNTESAAV